MLTFPFLAHVDVHVGFIKNIDNKKYKKALKNKKKRAKNEPWHVNSKNVAFWQVCVDLSVVSMINYNHQL